MKTSILVVADDALIRNNLVELLGEVGFDVVATDNGADGVALAKSRPPELVICDILLAELDGYAVLHALRDEPATAGVPFVFLTATGERTEAPLGMKHGDGDSLTKAFTISEVLEAVHTRLGRRDEVVAPTRKAAARQEILDALERTAGNQTRAAELLGISRRTLVSRLTEFDIPRPRKR